MLAAVKNRVLNVVNIHLTQGKQGQISYILANKKFLRFYLSPAKKFWRFPGLKLKRPAISHKKNFFLRPQKEVLAHALFLSCTVVIQK